jgi:hypothetical protein
MAKHLPIGGSTINRTINCPGWVQRCKAVPKRKAGDAANLGTLMHNCMEDYYQRGISFEKQLEEGRTFADQTLEEDHLPLLYKMLAHTEQVLDACDIVELVCEPFVQLIPELAGGSIDMLAVSGDGETVLILDYKTGVGVVRAEQNKQLQFYLLAAMKDGKTKHLFKKVKRFVGAIVQPKVFPDGADIWELYPEDLNRFSEEVFISIDKAQKEKAKLSAGSHCSFCPCAAFCKEKRRQADAALALSTTNQKELNKALPLALELKKWCEDVITQATDYAKDGVKITNHKIVHGRTIRKWANEEDASGLLLEAVGKAAFNKKLISPTQAVKLLKKEKIDLPALDELIVKPEGKPTLVNMDDPREEIILPSGAEKLKKALDKISDKK